MVKEISPENAAAVRAKMDAEPVDEQGNMGYRIEAGLFPQSPQEWAERQNAEDIDYGVATRLDNLNKIGNPKYYYIYVFDLPHKIAEAESKGYRKVPSNHFENTPYPHARLHIPDADFQNGASVGLIAMFCPEWMKRERDKRLLARSVETLTAAKIGPVPDDESGALWQDYGQLKNKLPMSAFN